MAVKDDQTLIYDSKSFGDYFIQNLSDIFQSHYPRISWEIDRLGNNYVNEGINLELIWIHST